MLRIAVCMADADFAEEISRSVKEWAAENCLNLKQDLFKTGEELLAAAELSGRYDVVLMEEELGGALSGIECIREIKNMQTNFCLIFFMQQEYERVFPFGPFAVFEKKSCPEKWKKCLNDAMEWYRFPVQIFNFQYKNVHYGIRLSEILYFASDKRIIRLRTEDGKEYCFYGKMDELEQRLEDYTLHFSRVHQSFLVNDRQIRLRTSKYLEMQNGERIPVSTDRRGVVRNLLGKI